MTLIHSISGIRGTLGGKPGESLTPVDIVNVVSAYGSWVKTTGDKKKVILGRDARLSGSAFSTIVAGTLRSLGLDVVDLDLSTTPTVELAVVWENAAGGIILTASHNPNNWNALKLFNEKGEFVTSEEGEQIKALLVKKDFSYVTSSQLGSYLKEERYIEKHVDEILELPLVNVEAIKKKDFRIVIDAVNSSGGIALPLLLEKLGVSKVEKMYCEPNGHFPHNPEPLPENLTEIIQKLKNGSYDLGFVVDPDVDRLAIICEDGTPFGEEYTLVAIADYILQNNPGTTVSNMSSTRALRDITENIGQKYFASPVGEVNVVKKMREVGAVIGGEGNGGVIYPDLHYGRDALVGIALFLSHLATFDGTANKLRKKYPSYHISKNKIELTSEIPLQLVLDEISKKYKKQEVDFSDGVKIYFDKEWVHLRKSNTEPIIRIYAESESEATAAHLANKIILDLKEIISRQGEPVV